MSLEQFERDWESHPNLLLINYVYIQMILLEASVMSPRNDWHLQTPRSPEVGCSGRRHYRSR